MGRGREAGLVAAGLALALAIFFQAQIRNGFTVMFGDRYDAVIEVALQQHWANVLHGRATWNVTGWFYPWPDTLGYNDGYFLYGLLYALWRGMGFDPFLACAFTHVAVKAVGFLSLYLLMRRAFARGRGTSLLAAFVFTIADNSLMQAVHAQLFMVSFAPLAALLLWKLRRAVAGGRGGPVLAWGATLDLFCGAWLISGFYTAWFFGFFMIVLLIVLWFIVPRTEWARFGTDIRRHTLPLTAVLLLGILACVPCLAVYLPIARLTGMHHLGGVWPFLPAPLDIFDVGTGNLLWGWLDAALARRLGGGFPGYSELTSGIPPLLVVAFLAGAWQAWRQHAVLSAAVAIAALLSWITILRIGNFSLWPAIMTLVPGARGVRVIARYQIFLVAPMAIVAAGWIEDLHLRHARTAGIGLAFLLVAEEINLVPPVHLPRLAELRFLAAVGHPPSGCRAFFATDPRPGIVNGAAITAIYSHNVDAMLVASFRHLPTINGLSTFDPPDWNFADPRRSDYSARVAAYAAAHRLHGLCRLDLAHARWERHPLLPSPRHDGAAG